MQQANELLNQGKEKKWIKLSEFNNLQGRLIKKGLRSPLPKFIPYSPVAPAVSQEQLPNATQKVEKK